MPARRLPTELRRSELPGLIRASRRVLGWLDSHPDGYAGHDANHEMADYARAWARALWGEKIYDRAARFERWARDLERIESPRCVKAAGSVVRAVARLTDQIAAAVVN